MDTPRTAFPTTLMTWVSEAVSKLPSRTWDTLTELLVGVMLASGGRITDALAAISPRLAWRSYHSLVEYGRWPLLALPRAVSSLLMREAPPAGPGGRHLYIIDDSLLPRCSKKAPGAAVRFDHARKPNASAWPLCQNIVLLSMAVRCRDGVFRAVPLIADLVRAATPKPKRTKLTDERKAAAKKEREEKKARRAAGTETEADRAPKPPKPFVPKLLGKPLVALALERALHGSLRPGIFLLDSWFMTKNVVGGLTKAGHGVVGQLKSNAVLLPLPGERAGTDGDGGGTERPDGRLDASSWPTRVVSIANYGGRRAVVSDRACLLRFLKGPPARVVRIRLEHGGGRKPGKEPRWCKPRMLASTDAALSAEEILEAYALRWPTEPLFRDLKDEAGLGAMWQRSKATLLRWLHLVMAAWTLFMLWTIRAEEAELAPILRIPGWRRRSARLTPGLLRNSFAVRFGRMEIIGHRTIDRRKSRHPEARPPPMDSKTSAAA